MTVSVFTRAVLFLCLLLPAPAKAQLSYADSIRQYLRQPQSKARQAELYLYLGQALYRSSPDSALYYSERGLALADEAQPENQDSLFFQNQGALLNNCAFLNQRKGNFYKAIQLYKRNIELSEKRDDTINVASAYMNLGTLYRDIGENDLALRSLAKAKTRLRTVDHTALGLCVLAIGTVSMARGENESALNSFFSALAQFKKDGYETGMGRALDNIGEVYFQRKNKEQALDYYRQALVYYRRSEDLKGLSEVKFHLARIFRATGPGDSAYYYAQQALENARTSGFPVNLRDASGLLYRLYEDRGQYREALEMHTLFKTMSDSLQAQETVRLAVREQLKADYETQSAVEKAEQRQKDLLNNEKLKRQQFINYISTGAGLLLLALLLVAVRSYRQKQKANLEINRQKDLLEEKSREVEDSIHCALRIQQALLPAYGQVKSALPDSFVLYLPRDIVSGDFYWINTTGDAVYLAACDSTGHGVPGAFVSLLNMSFLNEAITEKALGKVSHVFDFVRKRLIERLAGDDSQDGMDGILVKLDRKNPLRLSYAAANNVPLVIRKGAIVKMNADKMPVGRSPRENEPFRLFETEMEKGDLVILYTDGFADQFGGPQGKKFKYKTLDELLRSHAELPLSELQELLQQTFSAWKGPLEQVDDVLVIGFRV